MGDGDRSSSRRYNNRRDDRRVCRDNNRRDDRRHDSHRLEDRRNKCDLPPPPETGNPNDPFQHAKRSINMNVGGLKCSTSRRRYRKDNREVKLIHTKPSQPLCWSKQPITFSRAEQWVHIPNPGSYLLVVAFNVSYQDKMAFITSHGIYCYTTMTFRLKNTGATYQKAI
jgi:hypothetical protein